jgi:hypothetical protein
VPYGSQRDADVEKVLAVSVSLRGRQIYMSEASNPPGVAYNIIHLFLENHLLLFTNVRHTVGMSN